MVVTLGCTVLLALAAQDPSTLDPAEAQRLADDNVSLSLEVRRATDDQVLMSESLVYQGELLHLDLTIGFAQDFHDAKLINPWRMPLDLPVELQLPWEQDGDHWQSITTASPAGSSLVINRDKSLAERLADDGDGRRRYRVHRAVRITADQVFEIPVATMKVVWATKFEDDLARGLVPLDRQEAMVSTSSHSLQATVLPEQGRSESFKGAVGKFEMRLESELRVIEEPAVPQQLADVEASDAEAADVEVADGTDVDPELIWDIKIHTGGIGWLEKDMLATLEDLQGFHVRGQRSEVTDDGFVMIAELSTTDSALIPALPTWSYFNPSSATYVMLGPLPAVGSQVDVGAEQDSAGDGTDAAAEGVIDESSNLQLYWIGIGGAFFVFGMLHLMRRRPQGNRQEARGADKAKAVKPKSDRKAPNTRKPSSRTVPQPSDFIQKLADHVGCKREQVYTESFAGYLTRAGIPQPLRDRVQAAVTSIVGARFSGRGTMPSDQELRSILDELGR